MVAMKNSNNYDLKIFDSQESQKFQLDYKIPLILDQKTKTTEYDGLKETKKYHLTPQYHAFQFVNGLFFYSFYLK